MLGIVNNKTIEILNGTFYESQDIAIYFKGTIFNQKFLQNKYKIKVDATEKYIFALYKKLAQKFILELEGNFIIVIHDKKLSKTLLIKDKSAFLYLSKWYVYF